MLNQMVLMCSRNEALDGSDPAAAPVSSDEEPLTTDDEPTLDAVTA